MLRIACAALNQTPMDWSGNLARLAAALAEARKEQVDVVCFAELSISGYGCEDFFLSDYCYERSWRSCRNCS